MSYRIEVADFNSNDWVSVGLVDKTDREVRLYVCVVKRLYPGCRVRAVRPETEELVAVA